jgi:sugar/nucleoside kinase (ribokinase family)
MKLKKPFSLRVEPPTIVGTGLIALDFVLKSDAPEAPRQWAGGTCGNVLTILSYLGWNSYPVARLGDDHASRTVLQDMGRWGVQLHFATSLPSAEAPIVIHRICRNALGKPVHRFSLSCPYCGASMPTYKAVLASEARAISLKLPKANVFFMDRVSRGSLIMAKAHSDRGSLVFFEPSGIGDPKLFREALALSHVVKHSHERRIRIQNLCSGAGPLLEIETLGSDGLRFRGGITRRNGSEWRRMDPCSVGQVKDTAGAGDWCTAAIIYALGQGGLAGFRRSTVPQLCSALNLGQAMAAWNCGFEGARAAMYDVDQGTLRSEVTRMMRVTKAYAVTDHDEGVPVRAGMDLPLDRHVSWHRGPNAASSAVPFESAHRAACCF